MRVFLALNIPGDGNFSLKLYMFIIISRISNFALLLALMFAFGLFDLVFKFLTFRAYRLSANADGCIASFASPRTCRFWRPQGRDNSQGGKQKHRLLLCTSDSWEAGSQACGAQGLSS